MNALFVTVFLLCTLLLLIISPESFLAALIDGASKSATVCLSLVATYAVWLGLIRVWEDSGVARGISKLLKPIARRLFKTNSEETLNAACMNLSVNLLGISGAATPYGVKTARLLDKTEHAEYASAMFFVLNATSLQIFPTSMIAMRVSMHSVAPNDIILPILITTSCTTILGVLLTWGFLCPKNKQPAPFSTASTHKFIKTTGAGAR